MSKEVEIIILEQVKNKTLPLKLKVKGDLFKNFASVQVIETFTELEKTNKISGYIDYDTYDPVLVIQAPKTF